MAVNSASIVSSLGAGSGIDIKSLAEGLVDAERKPFKDRIDAKISKSEAKISGYGAVRSYLDSLKASFEKLNQASDFGGLTVTNSQPASFTATLGTGAASGTHDITVSQLASAQRNRSDGFLSASGDINGGQPLTLNLTVGGNLRPFTVGAPASPQAIVDAINSDATLNSTGLSADLVRYSSGGITRYAVEVEGQIGADKGFALAIDPASYGGSATPPVLQGTVLQEAADARLRVNGQSYTRSTNSIADVISNVTLELGAVTTSTARLGLTREVQSTKDNIKSLVSAYNDFNEAMKVLADSGSNVETLGGSLAGDRLLKSVRSQMRSLVGAAGVGGSSVNSLGDLGISMDLDGRLAIKSEAKLDRALQSNFEDSVRFFSSNTSTGQGLAGDALTSIEALVVNKSYNKGTLALQVQAVTKDVTKYKADLTKLEERLQRTLERYMTQFSVMQSIVGDSNSVRSGLKNTFEGMSSSY